VAVVVVTCESQEALDVEPAVGRVSPEARPAGFIERPDGGRGLGSGRRERGEDLIQPEAEVPAAG